MVSNQLSQEIIDQIRLTVRTSVKMAVKDVLEQYHIQNQDADSLKDEEYLSAEQAAKFLKIKVGTVYRKCEKAELPFHRLGKRKLLFNKNELITYINSRKINQQKTTNS